MNKQIISVLGANGSGKTTAAYKLAKTLADKSFRTILLLADSVTFPLGVGVKTYRKESSLGKLLNINIKSFDAITFDAIMDQFHTTVNDNLIVCGYAMNESANNYPEYDANVASFLIDRLISKSEIDYIVVDCDSDLNSSVLSTVAISRSKHIYFVSQVSSKYIVYFQQNTAFVNSLNPNTEQKIILNNYLPNDPIDAFSSKIGNVHFFLPYVNEIREQYIQRNILSSMKLKKVLIFNIKVANKDVKKYLSGLKNIVNDIVKDTTEE